MAAEFHYSHSNDVKYRKCHGFNSPITFLGSSSSTLEQVIRLARQMQLLLLCFAGNRRVLNLQNSVQQAAKEKKTEETASLEAQTTVPITLEAIR